MSKTMKEVKERVELKEGIGQHFEKWDNTPTYELISKKEKLKKLGLDIDKKAKYTLFDIPFETEKLLHEALINITIALGYDDKDAMEEGKYFQDEIEIIDALYNIMGGIGIIDMGGHIADISKAIKLKTNYQININTIQDRIFDKLEKWELESIEEQFIFEADIIDYLMDNADSLGMISPVVLETYEGDMEIVYGEYGRDGDYWSKKSVTAEEKRDEYISYLIEEAQKDLQYARKSARELLKDYKSVGTDERLSQEEKRQGILNTINILKETIQTDFKIKKIEYKPFEITGNKLLYTPKSGRNQKLERLIKLMQEANTNYVLKDDNENFFYPFIANIFFTHYSTEIILNKHEEIIKDIKEIEYESQKLDTKIIDVVDKEVKHSLSFHKKVRKNQIWNYATTVYAHKYNTDYSKMSKLIKFFIYEKPRINTNSLASPTKELPQPLTELDKFTKNI